MNPAGIFLKSRGIFPDIEYFIPFILDYCNPSADRKTGHHFRVPFINTKTSYVAEVLVPVELIKVYLPFQKVVYSTAEKIIKRTPIGIEEEISFYLDISANRPISISNIPELSGFLKRHIKKHYHDELDRQWVVKVSLPDRTYYFPSSVIGSFFCFPSSKFAVSLFLGNLSREVEASGKNPPFIQLRQNYPDIDAVYLYLYTVNREARKNFDSIGARHIVKKGNYRNVSCVGSEKPIRYTFKFPFPTSGNWELKVRSVPVDNRSFLVCEIIYVNTRKLLGIDYLEIIRKGCLGAKKHGRLLYFSSSVKSKTSGIYNALSGTDKKEYPEAVFCPFLSPPADKSVKTIKRIVYSKYAEASAVPIPQKRNGVKDLSNVIIFSKEGLNKPLRSKSKEISPRDVKSRRFDLETVKQLMNQVALSLRITVDYKEFVPKIPIEAPEGEISRLFYPDGKKRKVGVFFSDLPFGKKMTAVFLDQSSQNPENYITSPILIGNRNLEFPGETAYFFKKFMELTRRDFKDFCRRKMFEVYLKKPLQGNSKKDWENWVERMVRILTILTK